MSGPWEDYQDDVPPWELYKDSKPPEEPGFADAVTSGVGTGLRRAGTQVKQAYQGATGQPVDQTPEQGNEDLAQPPEWPKSMSDVGHQAKRATYQLAEGFSENAPAMVGAIAGSAAGAPLGGAVGTAIGGPPGGVAGTVMGGVAGAGIGGGLTAAALHYQPIYQEELKATNDPHEAANRTWKRAAAEGFGTGLSFATFEGGVLAKPLKDFFIQTLAQTAIGTGEQAASNVIDNRPATENLAQGAVQTGVNTALALGASKVIHSKDNQNPPGLSGEDTARLRAGLQTIADSGDWRSPEDRAGVVRQVFGNDQADQFQKLPEIHQEKLVQAADRELASRQKTGPTLAATDLGRTETAGPWEGYGPGDPASVLPDGQFTPASRPNVPGGSDAPQWQTAAENPAAQQGMTDAEIAVQGSATPGQVNAAGPGAEARLNKISDAVQGTEGVPGLQQKRDALANDPYYKRLIDKRSVGQGLTDKEGDFFRSTVLSINDLDRQIAEARNGLAQGASDARLGTSVGSGPGDRPFPINDPNLKPGWDWRLRQSQNEFFQQRAQTMTQDARSDFFKNMDADWTQRQAWREEQLRRAQETGEEPQYDAAWKAANDARQAYGDQKYKWSADAADPVDGQFKTDQFGFVLDKNDKPIRFTGNDRAPNRAAGRWILDVGQKGSDQVFDRENHPSGEGIGIRATKAEESARTQTDAGDQTGAQNESERTPPSGEQPPTNALPAPDTTPGADQAQLSVRGTTETPEEKVADTRRANAENVVNEFVQRLQARGQAGQQTAEAFKTALRSGLFTPEQLHAAYGMADQISRVLPSGAAPGIQFTPEDLTTSLGKDAVGRFTPATLENNTRALVELSLSENAIRYYAETGAHEGFHVLQRVLAEDPQFSQANKFLESMAPTGKDIPTDSIPSAIRNLLQNIRDPSSRDSYWDSLRQKGQPLEPGKTIPGDELQAYVYGAFDAARTNGQNPMGANMLRRLFNGIYDSKQRMGNWLRGNGYQTVRDLFGDVSEGQIAARGEGQYSLAGGNRETLSARGGRLQGKDRDLVNKIIKPLDEKSWWDRQKDAWESAKQNFTNRLYYNAIDRRYGVSEQENRLIGQKKIGKEDLYASKSASAMWQLYDRAGYFINQSMGDAGPAMYDGKGFKNTPITVNIGGQQVNANPISILAPFAKQGPGGIQEFFAYLASIRDERLHGEGRGSFDRADNAARIAKVESMWPEARDARAAFNAYNEALVKSAVNSGIISQETAVKFLKDQDYVPFYRETPDWTDTASLAPGVSQPFKTLKGGSDTRIGDPLGNWMKNISNITMASMRNVATQRAIRDASLLGEAHPTKDEAGPMKPNVVSFKNLGKQVNYALGVDNGKVVPNANSALVFDSMLAASAEPIGGLTSFFRIPTNVLRAMTTKNPVFFLFRHPLRESIQSWLTSGASMSALTDSLTGYWNVLRDKPSALALKSMGHGEGFDFQPGDINSMAKALQSRVTKEGLPNTTVLGGGWNALTDLWHRLSEASDMGTRDAIYRRALEQTKSPTNPGGDQYEASMQAVRQAIDFQRHGASQTLRAISAMVPFFNARLQGLDVVFRALNPYQTGAKGWGFNSMKDGAGKVWMNAAAISGLTALYYMNVRSNPMYQRAPDWLKDSAWLIPFGDGTHPDDKLFAVPIPFEAGVLFKNIPERFMRSIAGDDLPEDTRNAAARILAETLRFDPDPQAIKPLVESAFNYDTFRGAPIVNDSMKHLSPGLQSTPGTSEVAKGIAGGVNAASNAAGMGDQSSPMMVDHLIKGYFGTIGMYATALADHAVRAARGDIRPAQNASDNVMLRSVLKSDSTLGNQQVDEAYNFINRVQTITNDMNHLKKYGDAEGIRTLQKDHARELALAPIATTLQKALGHISQQEKMVLNSQDPNLTPDRRRELLDTLRTQRESITGNIQSLRRQLSN